MAQNQYRCEECGATFDNRADLERHNRHMHSLYTCEVCGETFHAETELEAHSAKMHPELQKYPR
jgi:transposase-like protein